MKFKCHQCGSCCHNTQPIMIWGWEKKKLEQAAQIRNITLDIRPECGFLQENKFLVYWYYFYMNGRCPFLLENNWCDIHAQKPLICAMYPYADRESQPDDTWRCLYEKDHNEIHHRKKWYLCPERYLPDTCVYAAKIVRLFNTQDHINLCCGFSDDYIRISKQNFDGIFEIKDLFEQLQEHENIPAIFFDAVQSYSFIDLTRTKSILQELDQKLGYIEINNRDIEYIFEHWKNTAHKKVIIKNIVT